MSTFTSDPQFGRGQTLGGYQTLTANDGTTVVGFQKFFSDSDPKTSEFFSNRSVGCVALRNSTGAALLPGDVVTYLLDAATAKAVPTDAQVAVVDEYLPASGNNAGVPVNGIFWGVINGPTRIKTGATPAAGTKLTLGTTTTAGTAVAGNGLGVALGAKNAAGLVRAIVGLGYHSAHVTSAT